MKGEARRASSIAITVANAIGMGNQGSSLWQQTEVGPSLTEVCPFWLSDSFLAAQARPATAAPNEQLVNNSEATATWNMRCHLAAEAFHRDGDWRYKYAPMPHQVHGQQPRPRQMTTADSITFARFVLFGFVTGPIRIFTPLPWPCIGFFSLVLYNFWCGYR